ncbi:MAG: hypothetical protein KGM97_07830 [Alphaproteobacteria bacterium]|nr:hypothetical protein [Alphaproteobacteria bacterium]MDE2630883.1 hypothetical protein [Alphaproteobacteria bacterium]
MLRNILLALGATLFAVGLVALLGGAFGPSLVAMVWGAVLVFGILYERYIYKAVVAKPPAGKNWVKTTERFIDDKTGKPVTVHYNTMTGERAYVSE